MRHRKLVQSLPVAVTNLRERIEHWRSTRAKRGRMPPDLWSEAARLARRHGIHPVAKALRLNYEALKAQGNGAKRKRYVPSLGPNFVQLDPLPSFPSPCSIVEVESPGGAKMIIRLAGVPTLDVVALIESFWSRER
jgi:hypothetical protein